MVIIKVEMKYNKFLNLKVFGNTIGCVLGFGYSLVLSLYVDARHPTETKHYFIINV